MSRLATCSTSAALAAALLLSGCGGGGLAERNAPDEFAISRSAPLVLPPDFALTPPKPGAPRPLSTDPQSQAVEALFGPGARVPQRSAVEQQILDRSGAARPDPGARSTAGDQSTKVVDKGLMVKELVDAPATPPADPSVAQVSIGG
jgi:hypothetical protein